LALKMIKRSVKKIRVKIIAAKNNFGIKWKFGVGATSAVLICGIIWWLALPLPQNYETEIPKRPKSYSAKIVSCGCQEETGAIIELEFRADQPALASLPEYEIEEITDQAKTRVIFEDISRIESDLDWLQVAGNPLVDSIKYEIDGARLILDIWRQGHYAAAAIETGRNFAKIVLPFAQENYPQIASQKPAPDSFAFPMRHTISFEATLSSPLKSAAVFVNEEFISFRQEQIKPDKYLFAFEQEVEIDKEYGIRAIVADQENRVSIATWNFAGQIPSAAILGKDRFQYLGWWGQINANGIAVRQEPAASSEKLGTLSTANRVKVIKETFGEWINQNNLWYQIDGGMYAGAYIFSGFVTPMAQPAPPAEFAIPGEVREGERWIDVDLSKKIMTLFDYDRPIFATYIAPGRDENPTRTGTYRVWYKLAKGDMQGGPPLHSYSYHLKDIPWIMYYNYDYAIHGTYWHDRFGMPQSAGCTNMTQGDAEFIFKNTLPEIPAGKEEVFARERPGIGYGAGTVVHNHK